MNVSRIDAEAALQDVDSARRQSRTHVGYQFGSLALLLWGALWIVAGVISAVWPDGAGAGWLVVDLIGTAAMGYLVLRNARRFSSYGASGVFRPSAQAIRFVVTAVVLGAFGAMVGLIFRPTSATEIMAFITILVAAIYMVAGLWAGLRLFVIGAVLAALVVSAFLIAPVQLPLIVSFLGGSALILGGLWMRWA